MHHRALYICCELFPSATNFVLAMCASRPFFTMCNASAWPPPSATKLSSSRCVSHVHSSQGVIHLPRCPPSATQPSSSRCARHVQSTQRVAKLLRCPPSATKLSSSRCVFHVHPLQECGTSASKSFRERLNFRPRDVCFTSILHSV